MVELVVLFTGLCGYVPIMDRDAMDVVLVDASHPDSVLGHRNRPDQNHVAGIVVHENYIDQSTRDRERLDYGYWFYPIKQEHVWINPSGEGLVINRASEPIDQCPRIESDRYLYDWVPPMNEVVPNRMLRDLPGSWNDRRLSGLVHLKDGEILSAGLAPDPDGEIALWGIRRSIASIHRQAVAETVALYRVLEGRIDTIQVCFDSSNPDGCDAGYLRLKAPREPREIVFWVKNLPREDLPPKHRDLDDIPDNNVHFAHMYRLLRGTQNSGVLKREAHPCPRPTPVPPDSLTPAQKKILELMARDDGKGASSPFGTHLSFFFVSNPQCPGASYENP